MYSKMIIKLTSSDHPQEFLFVYYVWGVYYFLPYRLQFQVLLDLEPITLKIRNNFCGWSLLTTLYLC